MCLKVFYCKSQIALKFHYKANSVPSLLLHENEPFSSDKECYSEGLIH